MTPELKARMEAEIAMMVGPEADALLVELREALRRKLLEDRYKGSHAAALGAACRLTLSLIRDIGATEGQRSRLKAIAVGLLQRGWDADLHNPTTN